MKSGLTDVAQSFSRPVLQEVYKNFLSELESTKNILHSSADRLNSKPRRQTIEKMRNATESQLRGLSFQLRLTQFLSSQEIEKPSARSRSDEQFLLLKRALDFYGLEMDERVENLIGPDDVVEVYDQSSTQLYRSLNFFQTSGYSLEDLLFNEWYVLWERPQSVIAKLMGGMQSLLKGEKDFLPFDVPTHTVREIFQDGTDQSQHRLLKVDLQFGIPLKLKSSKRISAIVVTSRCKLVAEGAQAQGLSFL